MAKPTKGPPEPGFLRDRRKTTLVFEFFAGTKSVGKVAERFGAQVVSVDIDGDFHPTICCDILKLRAADLLFAYGRPDFVWLSPPCTTYSNASGRSVSDRESDGSFAEPDR